MNSFFGCLCFSAYIIIFDLGTDIQIRPRSTYFPSQPLITFFFNFLRFKPGNTISMVLHKRVFVPTPTAPSTIAILGFPSQLFISFRRIA